MRSIRRSGWAPGRRGLRDRRAPQEGGTRPRRGGAPSGPDLRPCDGSSGPTRTSCPAACCNVSSSRWRSRPSRRCSSWTSRRRRSTRPSRPRCSISWLCFARSSTARSCSSATTSPSSPRCATASASCTPARLSSKGPAQEVFEDPRHPYTVGLLRCIPRRGHRKDHGRLDTIPGFLPAPGTVPSGCIFAERCALANGALRHRGAAALRGERTRVSRCHFHDQAPSTAEGDARKTCGSLRADEAARADHPAQERVEDRSGSRRARAGARRRQSRHPARRDARPGRRVGKRQDDARPRAARAHGPGPGLDDRARGQRARIRPRRPGAASS